jgi:hypothetical protein
LVAIDEETTVLTPVDDDEPESSGSPTAESNGSSSS